MMPQVIVSRNKDGTYSIVIISESGKGFVADRIHGQYYAGNFANFVAKEKGLPIYYIRSTLNPDKLIATEVR